MIKILTNTIQRESRRHVRPEDGGAGEGELLLLVQRVALVELQVADADPVLVCHVDPGDGDLGHLAAVADDRDGAVNVALEASHNKVQRGDLSI